MGNQDDAVPPVVSICCITYNHEKFIRDAINGFLMQMTDFPVEILIHDDASTDGTADIIREYQEKYPDIIKPIFQKENQYSQGKRGMFIRYVFPHARGKYIALCEGDDYWTDPMKLQKQVEFLEANEDFVICCHDSKVVDEDGRLLSDSRMQNRYKRNFTSEELFLIPHIDLLTMCFRNVIKEFPDECFMVVGGDRFLIALLAQYGKGAYIDSIQPAVYRKHQNGIFSGMDMSDQVVNYVKTRMCINKYYIRLGKYEYLDHINEDILMFIGREIKKNLEFQNHNIKQKDEQLRQKDEQLNHVYNSYTYKAGKILLWPVKSSLMFIKILKHLISRHNSIQ